jgi:hypothetical protein
MARRPLKVERNRRGSTRHFNVYVDPRLGSHGAKYADAVLARCERDYAKIASYFGPLKSRPGPFNVILIKNPGGAYHASCSATDLFCDASVNPANGRYTAMLNVMEFVEAFEAAHGKSWDCGKSSGEGLSRVLAADIYPNELNGFATADRWLDSKLRRNYVDHNLHSDTSDVANGCSVLFLNWLRHQLRYPWRQIVAAGGDSLGQTYAALTGRTDGFSRFKALLDAHFPPGRPCKLTTDNPFPL